jgi:hypothetical protein
VDDPRNVTCPDFVYPRETMFGRHIPAHNLHHPIVRGLPGAFRMPRGKWMCDEKEWRRYVPGRELMGVHCRLTLNLSVVVHSRG